jgi:hypothetical protein
VPVSACTATYVLWEEDGDSIEVRCELGPDEHDQHEALVPGKAGFTDHDLVIALPAKLCWPAETRVRTT